MRIPDEELTINGTLKVFYERDIPGPGGFHEDAVGPNAWKAVCEGYACGHCKAYASFRGSWLPRCPTCNAETGAAAPGQIAQAWW